MFDRRNLTSSGVGSPVYKFEGHDAAVLCVQVAGGSHLVSFNCSFNVHFSYGHFNWVLVTYNFDLFQWSPDKSSVFGSTAEDGILNIWDHDKVWTLIFLSHRPFCPMPPLFLWNVNLYIILILIKCRSYGLTNFIWVLELLKNLNSQAFLLLLFKPFQEK